MGELPEIAKYDTYFKDPEEPKPEKEEKKDEDEKKKDEHWQDEKFLYKENFGETLTKKQNPAIFIFDLVENKMSQVHFGDTLAQT